MIGLLYVRRLTLLLLALALCDCQSKQHSGSINTLPDFERSSFYQSHNLKTKDRWKLKNGNYANTFGVSSDPNISVEVETNGNSVIGFGLVFYKRDELGQRDLGLIHSLLESLDASIKPDSGIKEYLKANAEKSVFQIKQAEPRAFGKFKVYAGKVGEQQTISIDRDA
jgi:hypothetical protein